MVGAFINEDPTGDEGAKWMEEPLGCVWLSLAASLKSRNGSVSFDVCSTKIDADT